MFETFSLNQLFTGYFIASKELIFIARSQVHSQLLFCSLNKPYYVVFNYSMAAILLQKDHRLLLLSASLRLPF